MGPFLQFKICGDCYLLYNLAMREVYFSMPKILSTSRHNESSGRYCRATVFYLKTGCKLWSHCLANAEDELDQTCLAMGRDRMYIQCIDLALRGHLLAYDIRSGALLYKAPTELSSESRSALAPANVKGNELILTIRSVRLQTRLGEPSP
ncbi:hypothetical protein BDV12DRAFT_146182 [Aspergillus spectabilis]